LAGRPSGGSRFQRRSKRYSIGVAVRPGR
jgi:hypothetical protein